MTIVFFFFNYWYVTFRICLVSLFMSFILQIRIALSILSGAEVKTNYFVMASNLVPSLYHHDFPGLALSPVPCPSPSHAG